MAGIGAEKCKIIENLKSSVEKKFIEIRKAIEIREKLLLRQIDVISNQTQLLSTLSNIEDINFIPDNENELLQCLRNFGKFNIDNLNFTNDLYYIQEDYIQPSIDHEIMHKCLNIKTKSYNNIDDPLLNGNHHNQEEEIIVNFSNNKKLFKDNVNNINESIIHITLNEAKELIEKTKHSNAISINHLNDADSYIDNKIEQSQNNYDEREEHEHENFTSQSSQTDLSKISKHHINPNITINNCNGIINLKNISNLTINCVTQDSFNIPEKSNKQSIQSSDSYDSNDIQINSENEQFNKKSYNNTSSDIRSSDDINLTKDSENNSINNCEFYDRLISEIKHTLRQSQKAPVEYIPLERKEFNAKFGCDKDDDNNDINTDDDYNINGNILLPQSSMKTKTTTATANDSYNRKLLLKNFENLKIVLENNENDTHPVQIEQWLTEIISETEIEPMQNTDILEHSGINNITE